MLTKIIRSENDSNVMKREGENSSKVKYLTVTGFMAALITIMTAYICHVPIGVNGGYLHFGDSLIYLAAVLLPRPYALAAAAIGGGMADMSIPFIACSRRSFFIKNSPPFSKMLSICCGYG